MDKTALWEKCERLVYLYSLNVSELSRSQSAEEHRLCDQLAPLIGMGGFSKLLGRAYLVRRQRGEGVT